MRRPRFDIRLPALRWQLTAVECDRFVESVNARHRRERVRCFWWGFAVAMSVAALVWVVL